MEKEYSFFKNQYLDDIQNNYFMPLLNDVFAKYGNDIATMGDVGCGNGIFSGYLKEIRSIELYGFDASEYALDCALKNKFDKVFLNKDFSTEPLRVEDNYFDFILVKDVLEHLICPEFLIKEIVRALKPNGLLLLHVPNDFNLWKRIQFVFSNNIDTYGYFPGAKEWNQPHIRFFTYKGIKELLLLHNFEVVKSYSYFFAHQIPIIHRIPGVSGIFKQLADRLPSQFSQAITILARKEGESHTKITNRQLDKSLFSI